MKAFIKIFGTLGLESKEGTLIDVECGNIKAITSSCDYFTSHKE